MPSKNPAAPFQLVPALLQAYATNDRINQYLLDHLPEQAWRTPPVGGKGRDIASIVVHMHSVRLMWLKAAGYAGALPSKLEGRTISRNEAKEAMQASAQALQELLAAALASDGRIRGFKPDVAGFLAYLLTHNAHHRGQITQLARQLGHALPQAAMFGLWEWGTR